MVIYRSGREAVRDLFFTELTNLLESLAVYSCDVVLTGDFNVHVDDSQVAHAIKLNAMLVSFGLLQSVVGPTREQRTLDLVITRSDKPPPVVVVDPAEISDHSLVRFQLSIQRPPLQFVDVSTRA